MSKRAVFSLFALLTSVVAVACAGSNATPGEGTGPVADAGPNPACGDETCANDGGGALCGNGKTDLGEECDDGNTQGGDA